MRIVHPCIGMGGGGLGVVRPLTTGNIAFNIRSPTWDEWSYPKLLLLCGLSDPRITEVCERPRCFSIKLHSETQVSERLGRSGVNPQYTLRTHYRASEGKHSITPPSRHHMHIIHLITGLHCFYRLTMSLNWSLVPKSDVKHYFSNPDPVESSVLPCSLLLHAHSWEIVTHIQPARDVRPVIV